MITHKTIIERFGQKGEKTGWTYLFIPNDVAQKINPNYKKAFRVRGLVDAIPFEQIAMMPMGEGNFILPLKAILFKKIKKPLGEMVILKVEKDDFEKSLNEDFLACLEEDKMAYERFFAFSKSHHKYFDNYVEAAKTDATKAKRIAQILEAMHRNWNYAEMIRANNSKNQNG